MICKYMYIYADFLKQSKTSSTDIPSELLWIALNSATYILHTSEMISVVITTPHL